MMQSRLITAGFPLFWGSTTKAPFDVVSDYLRGYRGAMLDIHRSPDELIREMTSLSRGVMP